MRRVSLYNLFWGSVLYGTFFGWGGFIWWLCRPGFSIKETLIMEVVAYAVVGFFCLGLANGVGTVPVRIVK